MQTRRNNGDNDLNSETSISHPPSLHTQPKYQQNAYIPKSHGKRTFVSSFPLCLPTSPFPSTLRQGSFSLHLNTHSSPDPITPVNVYSITTLKNKGNANALSP